MDKNTLVGFLLMGAVILGFMWINQPSEEELARQREQAEQLARQADEQANTHDVLTVDSVSPAEIAAITSTVRQFGTADTITGRTTLAMGTTVLTVASDGAIGGAVTTPTGTVDVADIVAAHLQAYKPATASAAVAELRQALANVARYKGFARHLTGKEETVTLENDRLSIDFSTRGGAIVKASLKNYQTYDSTAVTPITPDGDAYSFILTTASQRIDTRELYFTPEVESDSVVTMALDLGDGARFAIRYTLRPDSYLVGLDVLQEGMQTVVPTNVSSLDFVWHERLNRNESGRMFEERNSAIYYMFMDGDVKNLSENSDDRKELTERVKWIGFKNQFFSTVLIPRTNFQTATIDSEVLKNNPDALKNYSLEATMEYGSTLANPVAMDIFIGPNSYPLLDGLSETVAPEEDLHLTRLIPLGWKLFRWINTIIVIPVFDLLGKYISSYGIIILLLTVFIKIILFPFTYKSYMSQAKMRVLAPEIKEINDKYPGNENAMKRQQETMALYSRAGANPMSGCLPMLLQMPILIAMFNFFPSAIELRGQSFLWAHDLSAPDAIISWNTHIPLISDYFGNHISLFCLLMTAVNLVYIHLTMQNQPAGSTPGAMKTMQYLFPVMFLVIFNNYASGLSYYYFLSLLITIAQTYAFRYFVNEDKVRATMRENAKKPRKKSGFMARLEEAQRQQQAMMREQEKRKGKKR